VTKPDLLLELLVVALDTPAQFGKIDEPAEAARPRLQDGDPARCVRDGQKERWGAPGIDGVTFEAIEAQGVEARVRRDGPKVAPSRIGPISCDVKQMGARNAGNPHVACDVEGVETWCGSGPPGHTGAPALDPTCEGLGVKFPGPTRQSRRFDREALAAVSLFMLPPR
jgi:hypothetical protein